MPTISHISSPSTAPRMNSSYGSCNSARNRIFGFFDFVPAPVPVPVPVSVSVTGS